MKIAVTALNKKRKTCLTTASNDSQISGYVLQTEYTLYQCAYSVIHRKSASFDRTPPTASNRTDTVLQLARLLSPRMLEIE